MLAGIYIFLVFFVVMSMFIALISEAYETAREATENHISTSINSSVGGSGSAEEILQESERRIALAVEMKLISRKMFHELARF